MKKILILWLLLLCPQLAMAQGTFNANSQIAVKSQIAAANTTSVVIKNSPGTVYSIDAFNNSGGIVYLKLFNVPAASVTCGTTVPYARYMIPFGASSSGGGFGLPNINGDSYFQGISACVTTGIQDSDTGAPTANTVIFNVHFQ